MDEQISIFSDNPEYDAFVNKFKPKKLQMIVIHHLPCMMRCAIGRAKSTGLIRPALYGRFTLAVTMRIMNIRTDALFWITRLFQSCLKYANFTWTVTFRFSCLPRP